MGILDVLLLIFLVLKIAGLVNWSWGAVLVPLYVIIILSPFAPTSKKEDDDASKGRKNK